MHCEDAMRGYRDQADRHRASGVSRGRVGPSNGRLVKINPLVRWTKQQVWGYIAKTQPSYNPLHDKGYPSIGCTALHATVLLGGAERSRPVGGPRKKGNAGCTLRLNRLRFSAERSAAKDAA